MELERIKDEASRKLSQLKEQIEELKERVKSLKNKLSANLPVGRADKPEPTRITTQPLSPIAVLGSVERLLEEMDRQLRIPMGWQGGWWPKVDVLQRDKEIVVRADLPGVDPKDVEITVVSGQLVLRGSKQASYSSSEGGVLMSECYYGAFERMIPLPAEVDVSRAEATYRDGVLEVRLPLVSTKDHKPVKVKVKSA